ncbi:MAG TPA: response regulator transcription factor [Candidatus Acidoferrum sp.]|jgi:DNA-binding response OmpR family regulator|nr:response regulator transcription factor [Candidatus Acidoferrum sp.]
MYESILLVEDEAALRATLGDRLRGEGYAVDTAVDGLEAVEKAANVPYDLVILDLMLPSKSGFEVCRDIRQAGMATPILILTARDQTADKVAGLKLGADDYVTKPFEVAELIARIEVLLRRVQVKNGQGVYDFGSIHVDVKRSQVTREGKPIYLTGREFQLLRYLIEHPGITVSRKELLQLVWGYVADSLTRTVDTHVGSLRQKLEENPKRPEFIVTVSGIGYKFAGSKRS